LRLRDIASAGTADSFHPWNSCRLVNCFVARPPGSLGAGARFGNVARLALVRWTEPVVAPPP